MVHALSESRRVLDAEGMLIDLRPLSTTFPIHAIAGSSERRVGEGNATATIDDERAADRALEHHTDCGWLVPRERTFFEMYFYWDTTAEMAVYLRSGRVPKTVTPAYPEIDAALRAASDRAGGPARLRATRRFTLGTYATGQAGARS